MPTSTRQKAVRAVVSTLISSSLTEREINDIAYAFESDREFVYMISRTLRDVSEQLSKSTSLSKFENQREKLPQSLAIQAADELVKKLELTQNRLLELLRSNLPEVYYRLNLKAKRLKTIDLIACIFETEIGSDRFMKLLRSLEKRGGSDAYLDLIDKRQDSES